MLPRAPRIALLATLLAAVFACSPPPNTNDGSATTDARDTSPTDGPASDAPTDGPPTRCSVDMDCADGVFCNGTERCMPSAAGADARGCVAANPATPCASGQQCNEGMQRCTACMTDADGDGHRSLLCGGDDCDDLDPNRYPGNAEVCDLMGHDEDCDPCTTASPGSASDGDADHDGAINANCRNSFVTAPTCDPLTTRIDTTNSWVTGADCNDANPNQRPNQVEICNGIDDNCDGRVDESGNSTFYRDADGDMHGDPLSPVASTLCAPPAGFTSTADDCNDTEATIYIGAPEICDGLDNDCSLPPGRAGGRDSTEDADNDHYSPPAATCTGGPFPATDCDDTRLSVHPGAPEICDGLDNECNGTIDDAALANAACGTALPHMTSVCSAGTCAPGACALGYGDCDGSTANGCEVDFATTRDHCGSCRTACGGGSACVGGVCDAIIAVDGGDAHTCILHAGGTVGCWGTNSDGRLGDGSRIDSAVPVSVSGLSDATQIAAGAVSMCALRRDGTVVCWGDNTYGALGDGTMTARTTPTMVPGLDHVTQITSGNFHYCALRDDATIRCWGGNFLGALGDGTTTDRSSPVAVTGVSDATAVAARGRTTCAIRAGGSIWCWGANDYGQIGIASTFSDMTNPHPMAVRIGTLSGALQLALGQNHVCARFASSVQCWGDQSYGQVGTVALATPHPLPNTIAGLTDATRIAASGVFTCALRATGNVVCWGHDFGLGDGNATHMSCAYGNDCSPTPVTSRGIVGATVIGPGTTRSACAVNGTGQLACWTGGAAPSLTAGTANVVELSSGMNFTCGRMGTGRAMCWGNNNVYGQLGDGTATASTLPVTVNGVDHIAQIAAGGEFACARRVDGSVVCWGLDDNGQLGNGTVIPRGSATPSPPGAPVTGLTDAIDVSSNGTFSSSDGAGRACAVRATGEVVCWGGNEFMALGDGVGTHSTCMHGAGTRAYTVDCALTPVTVTGITSATRVAVGVYHTCALLADGTATCWGSNMYGQLGDGTAVDSATPVRVMGLSGAVQISAEGRSTCARTRAGALFCWGDNSIGSLGDGTTTSHRTAMPVSGIGSGSTEISGAPGLLTSDYYCATIAGGAVRCWGLNSAGQLGDGTLTNRSTPVATGTLTNVVSLGTQRGSACALDASSAVACWSGGTGPAPFAWF